MAWLRDAAWEERTRDTLRKAGMAEADLPTAHVEPDAQLYALVARETWEGESEPRWHISIQRRGRIPSWSEVARAAHELRPGVGFVVSIPPKSLWMNLHPHVLHLQEVRDPGLVAQWRANARGDQPT
jgi:hypothetical protein